MITLTPIAQKYIRAIARQENLPEEAALRLGLVPQGCEGSGTKFRYEIAFDANAAGPDDEVFESEGIHIYIDRRSLPYVDGLELDVRSELGATTLVFRNPMAKHTCGCGHTFSN